jgi:hypothetical protein
MTDEELISTIMQHVDRFMVTVDEEGAPFYALDDVRLSSSRTDGVEQKIIIWLLPEKLEDNWKPFSPA